MAIMMPIKPGESANFHPGSNPNQKNQSKWIRLIAYKARHPIRTPRQLARFVAAGAEHARFFTASGQAGHSLFDLPGFITARLEAAGAGSFENLGFDTYADPERFYSYRRATHLKEADYGRLVGAIALA